MREILGFYYQHVASTLAAVMCSCKTWSFNRNLHHRNRVSDNPNDSFQKYWFSVSETVDKTQNRDTDVENKHGYQGGEVGVGKGGWDELGDWD